MKTIAELKKMKDDIRKQMGEYLTELSNWDNYLEKNSEYQKGFEDAWNLAGKIALPPIKNGLSFNDMRDCFGIEDHYQILSNLTGKDAMKKYKSWLEKKEQEKKEKDIQVGDLIRHKNSPYTMVVIAALLYDHANNRTRYTCVDLETGQVWHFDNTADISKIGEHYDLPWSKEKQNESSE